MGENPNPERFLHLRGLSLKLCESGSDDDALGFGPR